MKIPNLRIEQCRYPDFIAPYLFPNLFECQTFFSPWPQKRLGGGYSGWRVVLLKFGRSYRHCQCYFGEFKGIITYSVGRHSLIEYDGGNITLM
jgi:hypothetical protein